MKKYRWYDSRLLALLVFHFYLVAPGRIIEWETCKYLHLSKLHELSYSYVPFYSSLQVRLQVPILLVQVARCYYECFYF